MRDRILKRAFDITASLSGLLLLIIPFAVIMAMIKLESKGTVLFRQRRHGFNQNEFRISKFRTMWVLEDGEYIAQAKQNDPRITKVGSFLRRTNLDEFPQLWNVLCGDMSLVGPRPHTLAHNRMYEEQIALYARRHNVKPGITGWAQVNGCRGETDTTDKMEQRLAYDLFYIDNWSFKLDMKILFLTFFSRKAFVNAL
jgi:exopolysaccharide biosynthesis polyprenyl glycosylphosphotransferase